jgi:hypothetical protein
MMVGRRDGFTDGDDSMMLRGCRSLEIFLGQTAAQEPRESVLLMINGKAYCCNADD